MSFRGRKQEKFKEISIFHSSVHEDYYLLESGAVKSGRYLLIFGGICCLLIVFFYLEYEGGTR
jgi:hypothetical protein